MISHSLRFAVFTGLVLAKAALFISTASAQIEDTPKAERIPVEDERTSSGLDRVVDFLTIEPNQERAAASDSIYPAKIVFAPYIIYTPETNIGFGIGGSYLFKMPNSGGEERTRTSAIPIAFTYTLENQVLFYSGFEIFWPDETWVLSGNLRAQIFPQLFYGVGVNTPVQNEVVFESTQFVVEPILTKQLFIDKLFIGGGIRYRHVVDTDFTLVEEGEEFPAAAVEFDNISGARGSTSAGVEAAALYDTRNSLLNAQTGTYLEATYGIYREVLGGTHAYNLARVDARRFFQLNGTERHRDVLGLHAVGYSTSGNVPLVELGQLGSGEIMRGYYEGRYTDRHYVATQAEYRLNLKESPWGAVGFVSAGAVSPGVSDFFDQPLRTALGAGVRYEVDRVERLNLRADVAFTGEGDFNFYIQIGEAF